MTAEEPAADVELSAEPAGPKRRTWPFWLLAAAVFIAGGVLVTKKSSDDLAKLPPGKKLTGAAPNFKLGEVRKGKPDVELASLRGQPVVLNFFGSWCTPCLRELPDLQAASKEYAGKVAFVGVTQNDTRPAAISVLKSSGVTYPAAFDGKNVVATDYALDRMPTTVFISAEGELLYRVNRALSEPQLRHAIERLFFS